MTALLFCALAASVASAQGGGGLTVRWDSLGTGETIFFSDPTIKALFLVPSADGDPFADTLYGADGGYVYRFLPDDRYFGFPHSEGDRVSPGDNYFVSTKGTHLSNRTGINYSLDYGATWEEAAMYRDGEVYDNANVNAFAESEKYGLLAAGQGGFLWQSLNDGLYWTVLHDFEIGFSNLQAVLELSGDTQPDGEPSPWAGRIVVSLRGGMYFSDDGGETWTEVRLLSAEWDQLEEAPDGTLYTAASGEPIVYVSHDGGASWEELVWFRPGDPRDFLNGPPEAAQIAVAIDGTLWVGLSATNGDPILEATVLYTQDGGATWIEAANGFGRRHIFDLAFDSAGRLIAATRFKGVWRTAAPVVVSAEEGMSEPGKPGEAVALDAPYPNPTTGTVTVPLRLRAPADLTVVAYDVLGREVATLHAGSLTAGTYAFALDAEALAAGLYVVRAVGPDGAAVQRFTVGR